ncbi:MAG: DUF86 domain-containing protein [Acidobacteria bacterium]|nr:DUF86 domain-containing protein [Acidobacteriota bacterium]
MRREAKKYLLDIQRAATLALEFVTGRTLADYEATPMLRAAVERQCEIMGEALAKLARVDEAVATRIHEHRRIIAFRNILIHGYAEVDHRLVWDVVTTKVPTLHADVTSLMSED